jgi:cytochrome c1
MASEAKLETVKVGTDEQTMERGLDTFMANCNSCHSLKYIKYRNLVAAGMEKAKVDALRGDKPMGAAIMSQMSEADAAQVFGVAPPDLSLMAQARDGGVNYVYSYLLGYYSGPEGSGNHIYPVTKMPDILGISSATDPAQRAEIAEKARLITSFLAWAADPHAQERLRIGYYVLAYLVVLTTLLYLVKKRVWAKLK